MVRFHWLEGVGFESLVTCPNVRLSPLGVKTSKGRVRCGICERHCQLLDGQVGFCGTRMNIFGELYTLVYGDISSISGNPIEKKPFFHFYPGSYALTIGTWGCNYACRWCQNFEISKYSPNPTSARFVSFGELIEKAVAEGCHGISISFNEPTMLFEYSLDIFPMAHQKGLYNNYVSNGYMTAEALKMLRGAGMDAIKFDVKGSRRVVRRECAADLEIVWRNIRHAKELGLHVEVVNLVIPGVNDDEASVREIVQRLLKEAGVDVPIHFTRFYPAYKMTIGPITSIESLEAAYRIARKEGINFVYLGNVPGHRFENTYCPKCNHLLIQRYGFTILRYNLDKKHCPDCGQPIPLRG